METTAKILIYDLEVSPILGWTYQLWDARVLKVEQNASIMSISWRWYGEKVTHHANLVNVTRVNDDTANLALVKLIRKLFDEADIVVAHNANRFDNKVATASFLRYGLTPPSPYKTVDTLQVARSVAKFASNSLDSLCEMFGIGRKSKVTHADLWYQCLNGDMKAWKQMEKYNNQDVDLLYQLYEKLRPYMKNHPNMGHLRQRHGICPKCSSDKLEKRGFNTSAAGKKQRYQCQNCGGWSNESSIKKIGYAVNA